MSDHVVYTDTGYDLINLDSAIVARYYQDVPGANADTVPGTYTFPCNASLPDLDLTIDTGGATIRGHVLNYHPYNIGANSKRFSLDILWDPIPVSYQTMSADRKTQSVWVPYKALARAVPLYLAKPS